MTLTPRDKQNLKTFGYGVLAVLAGGLIYLLCLAACFWQSRYGVESETAIEWVQDIVLLISMGSFFTLAKLIPEERGGILLMAGFMTSLFIREQDAYFDFISKSAWQIVLAVFLVILGRLAAGAVGSARRRRAFRPLSILCRQDRRSRYAPCLFPPLRLRPPLVSLHLRRRPEVHREAPF